VITAAVWSYTEHETRAPDTDVLVTDLSVVVRAESGHSGAVTLDSTLRGHGEQVNVDATSGDPSIPLNNPR